MNPTVRAWIDGNEADALRVWLTAGNASALPEAEKAEWARYAAAKGRASALQALAECCHGLDLSPDEEGRTLLHAAAQSGNAETMAFALRILGFSAAEGDKRGVTPLELAARHSPEALEALETLSGVRLRDCDRNPVLRGFHPDPSIVRVGEDFYLVNSSFVYLPALPISHSRDLIHWETVGHVFTDAETARLTGLPGGFGYWAPDISYDGQRFWIVATLRLNVPPFRTQMITSAPAPEGPWSPPRFLDVDGIDPSIFTDDDGRRYLVVNPGARIAELSEDGELLSGPRMIYYGSNRRKSEGPHLLKKDGWYYLFQAEGGTGSGHMVTCARSKRLDGPYVSCPWNPILTQRNPDGYIRRAGHGKPVRLPDGRWALPYLCGRSVEGMTLMGRETALDPLEWTPDGWPLVNRLRGPSCLQARPLPAMPVGSSQDPWICPRETPDRFAETQGQLILIQGGRSLSSLSGAHLLLHRQTESAVIQSAPVDVSEMEAGGIAGLTGYYDERSYYLFGVRKTSQGGELVLREQAGGECRDTVLSVLEKPGAVLETVGKGLTRVLRCRDAAFETEISIRYLTDEGLKPGKRFTGAALGLAAEGQGTARFSDYREVMTDERDG